MSIIINADDLGYSMHRDAGIFHAFQNRSISAASLLVNGPTAESAARKAKEVGMFIGLHLNLTEGRALSGPSSITKGETLYYKHDFDRMFEKDPEPHSSDIEKETRAQIEHFKVLTGSWPKHVDGHQHIHVLPGMPALLAPVFQEFGIESTRIPQEEKLSQCTWLDKDRQSEYKDRLAGCDSARIIYNSHGLWTPDQFVGLTLMGTHMNIDRITAAIRPSPGIMEWMVHPGDVQREPSSFTSIFCDIFDTETGRAHELQVLTNLKLTVPLIDWNLICVHSNR
jgi:predicted glycoside hydrolase/deacetylase ChbG (UPF0249 family)